MQKWNMLRSWCGFHPDPIATIHACHQSELTCRRINQESPIRKGLSPWSCVWGDTNFCPTTNVDKKRACYSVQLYTRGSRRSDDPCQAIYLRLRLQGGARQAWHSCQIPVLTTVRWEGGARAEAPSFTLTYKHFITLLWLKEPLKAHHQYHIWTSPLCLTVQCRAPYSEGNNTQQNSQHSFTIMSGSKAQD